MNLHQERAAAVRHLVDEARLIEKAGVTRANLDKIGVLLSSLASRADHPSPLVREHVAWALARHAKGSPP